MRPDFSHFPGRHGHSSGRRDGAPNQGPVTSTSNTGWGSNFSVVVSSARCQADSPNVRGYLSCYFLCRRSLPSVADVSTISTMLWA